MCWHWVSFKAVSCKRNPSLHWWNICYASQSKSSCFRCRHCSSFSNQVHWWSQWCKQ